MEQYQHIASVLALTMGVSWASGINLYAALAVLGYSGATGNIELPPDLLILQNPLVIVAASSMYAVEFFVDKIPGLDTAWDGIHTFIRIPAGALLAAGAVGEAGTGMQLAAAIMGGGLATASHATKAGSRIVINASPEPFTNWAASIGEDVMVIGGLWTALYHPWWFLAGLIVFMVFMAWLLPKIWRAIKKVFGWLGRLFGGKVEPPEKVAAEPGAETETGMEEENMAAPASPDTLNQLERLAALHDSGALTDEEFTKQKGKLLDDGDRGAQG